MARAKKYLDVDVVTAARERIEHIYDLFDSRVVMFSGGKDSLAVLTLMREFHEREGLGKITAVFRHEEVINPSVVEFVETFRGLDWLDLHWFCLPALNSKFSLGRREPYIEWDPTREWVGVQPDWAITAKELGCPTDGSISQSSADDIISGYLNLKGKVAHITGIRASESLVRFRSVTQKLNENYISSIEGNTRSRVKLCKPIYDWEQDDVLKFLHETGAGWCPLYEAQDLASMGLRVSTALHVASAKKTDKLMAVEPEFYNRIIQVFPDMADQGRYWSEYDDKAISRRYAAKGFPGVREYVEDNMADEDKELAFKRITLWEQRNLTDPENYPVELLLKHVMNGILDHRLAGKYVNSKAERNK